MHAVPVIRLFALTSRACMILPHVQAIPSSLYSKPDFRQKCSSQNAQLLLKSSAIKCSLNKTKQWHRSISVSSYLFFVAFRIKTTIRLLLKKQHVFLLDCYFTLIDPLEFVEHINNVIPEKFILQSVYV